ncbi:MAG: hypothetical protein R3E31_21475 [Chloroflexota bacterium]
MEESALTLIQTLPDAHLQVFAARLHAWLVADLNQSSEAVPDFTESRAKALLRAANVVDDPTLHSFAKLVEAETAASNETAVRLALFDLLNETNLASESETQAIAAAATHAETANRQAPFPWLSLSIAAFAWKSEYPLYQLDPASPPGEYSPAGQLVKRAAFFLRQQVQRSATDRDKLARKLAYTEGETAVSGTPTLEQLNTQEPIAPLPPHYRPPIPVRYPEVARDTLQIAPDEPVAAEPPALRADSLTIETDDLPGEHVTRMPPIRITKEQLPPPRPQTTPRVVTPQPTTTTSTVNFADNVRQIFGRGREPMKTTKLRIVVEEFPDGPGLYGLQIKVSCRGVKSYVAGTTNREGKFLCELPVRIHSGLTYDVDVTWPRDLGGETERKSITLNADRTEFVLPFYRKLLKDEG